MSNALTLILNGLLQGDLDAGGHKILNLDTSNLGLGEFGPQEANTVFAGPASGDDAVPVFRVLTASEVGAQPASANLTEFATMNPTLVGANFITLVAPVDTGFVNVGNDLDNTITYRTPAQVLGDIGAQPESTNLNNISLLGDPNADRILFWDDSAGGFVYLSLGSNLSITGTVLSAAGGAPPFSDASALVQGSGSSLKQFRIEVDGLSNGTRVMTPPDYDFTPASIAGEESLIKKRINGLLVSVGDAVSAGGAVTYDESPDFPFNLSLVAISQSGTSGVFRTTAPFDVVVPVSGTLAIVAETIALASMSVNKDLGGSLASDVKVSSQLAIKTYVDSHTGAGKQAVSGDTIASATSVDLSATTDYQLDVSGTTNIEQFVIDEDEERVVVFEDALTLIHSANLLLPGSENISVSEGDYAVVRGQAGGVTALLKMVKGSLAPTSEVADFKGGSVIGLTHLGVIGVDGNFDLRFRSDDVFTANRTLRFTLGDEDREVGIYGDVTFAGDFLLFGGFGTTLTVTGLTSVTLPTTGTVSTLAGAEAFTNKTGFNGVKLFSGTGTPEGAITAPVGSFFSRTDGGAATTLYVKESGAGNTGWAAK